MTKLLLKCIALAGLLTSAACAPTHQVTNRTLSAIASGGSQEVWIVMGETGVEVTGDTGVINHDAYAVYHCIPSGCKRVGALRGTEAVARGNHR